MKRQSAIWTTKDNQRLEVFWMDSVHLAHSLNLLIRRSGVSLTEALHRSSVGRELNERDLTSELQRTFAIDFEQFQPPKQRETIEQLCLYNALREYDALPDWACHIRSTPRQVMSKLQRDHPQWWATYSKLRLTR
jgi:hypothetical protein